MTNRYGRPKDYDADVLLSDPDYLPLQRRIAIIVRERIRSLPRPVTIFEIGTGPGTTTEALINEIREPKVKILSVDRDPEMIAIAKKRRLGYRRVKYQPGDVTEIASGMRDGSFRVIVSGCTTHNLPPEKRDELFAQIYRLLKPGGIFVNGDKIAVDDEMEHLHLLAADICGLGVLGPDKAKMWTEHYLQDDEIKMTDSEYCATMAKLGFREIDLDTRFTLNRIIVAKK